VVEAKGRKERLAFDRQRSSPPNPPFDHLFCPSKNNLFLQSLNFIQIFIFSMFWPLVSLPKMGFLATSGSSHFHFHSSISFHFIPAHLFCANFPPPSLPYNANFPFYSISATVQCAHPIANIFVHQINWPKAA
jgi:hypothetical protein